MVVRLILCFDGTWDRPDNATDISKRVESNVVRFYESVVSGKLSDGSVQTKWYDTGVGTDWYDRVAGGAFGFGLDQKIRDGYQWLADHYPAPDPGNYEVFIVGFSRGAYTARSLVGMIRNVGLLDGSPVWINRKMLKGLRQPRPDETGGPPPTGMNARACFLIGKITRFIQEKVDQGKTVIGQA